MLLDAARDIAELLDLITDHRLPSPPFADFPDELKPFAVEARGGLIARIASAQQAFQKPFSTL